MQLEPRVLDQPAVHGGSLVGGEVVTDQVDRQARLDLPVDLGEEPGEVLGGVPGGGCTDHRAGGGVQRREQVDGAVAVVVVAAVLRCARHHRQHRRGPFQGLDLWFLVDGEDRRVLRRGQVQAHHVPDLVD